MALLPVDEAKARILAGVAPLAAENVKLAEAAGRVLATAVTAARDQPPFPASAMDGYAVRGGDVAEVPVSLKVIGMAAAGHGFRGRVDRGEAVRIFTGAPMPRGADTVVIQENTAATATGAVTIRERPRPGQHVRQRALDFTRGETLIAAGTRLSTRDLGLAAAANRALLRVRKKPLVAILATGDELVAPGRKPRADQIVSSNGQGLAALARHFGAEVRDLGIVRDDLGATVRAIKRAAGADILLTSGGASVGEHDFVLAALKRAGVTVDFWKIAMRPGKPFMYGRRKRQHVMGLPGNPVSALVCARLFLKPLLDALLGVGGDAAPTEARLATTIGANDGRQDYVRATLDVAADGGRLVRPFARQDSSMQRTFREAQCLIIRPPFAPEAPAGSLVPILILDF